MCVCVRIISPNRKLPLSNITSQNIAKCTCTCTQCMWHCMNCFLREVKLSGNTGIVEKSTTFIFSKHCNQPVQVIPSPRKQEWLPHTQLYLVPPPPPPLPSPLTSAIESVVIDHLADGGKAVFLRDVVLLILVLLDVVVSHLTFMAVCGNTCTSMHSSMGYSGWGLQEIITRLQKKTTSHQEQHTFRQQSDG